MKNRVLMTVLMVTGGFSFGAVSNDEILKQEVLKDWKRVETLINAPQDLRMEINVSEIVQFNLLKETLRCTANESLAEAGLVGVCTFEATGKKDAIDLVVALNISDAKTFKGPKEYSTHILSRHED